MATTEDILVYATIFALFLSTVSLLLSSLTLRRQGIPGEFEVERIIYEKLARSGADDKIQADDITFNIIYISVTRESGFRSIPKFKNLVKEYWTGRLQGRTQVAIGLDDGEFDDDFSGEIIFPSSVQGDVKVQVNDVTTAHESIVGVRTMDFETADPGDIYSYMMWMPIDELPKYVHLNE